jgi:hypothetical protein
MENEIQLTILINEWNEVVASLKGTKQKKFNSIFHEYLNRKFSNQNNIVYCALMQVPIT